MGSFKNEIETHHRSVFDILNEQKYTIDFFQREYSWGRKHIETLVTNLASTFLTEYTSRDKQKGGEKYSDRHLSPFVVGLKDRKHSIIDEWQHPTSLTLFLIYFNNLQKKLNQSEEVEPMIFSELRGGKSFSITIEERVTCLEALFNHGEYDPHEDDDESAINMTKHYQDIMEAFPEKLKNEAFPFFIDQLKYNVIMVEVIAYSDENTYTIFETMDNRRLNLTPSEMLKGFILSRSKNSDKRKLSNEQWKKTMIDLKSFKRDEEQRFSQSWLRAKYTDSIRSGGVGSQNEDFEKIGTHFHSWVRGNLKRIGLDENDDQTFENLTQKDFKFYLKSYIKILNVEKTLTTELEYVYYINQWSVAPTLSSPLMLSPLNLSDSEEIVCGKISIVARYIETFVVKHSTNFRKFSANSVRYTMYLLTKDTRGKNISELKTIPSKGLSKIQESFNGAADLRLHGQDYRFVKFLLSRIIAWVEQKAGINTNFISYFQPESRRPFEVEHIWTDRFLDHTDEFKQEHEFEQYQNKIGDLVLLPRSINQSCRDLPYEKEHTHYIKENLLVKSLYPLAYGKNPNFVNPTSELNLLFRAHTEFKRKDIDERQRLYQAICEQIWDRELKDQES